MKKALIIALCEEYDEYDLLLGVGPNQTIEKFSKFIEENPDLEQVINYGTCGSLDKKYSGIYKITTFSNTMDNQMLGDGKGMHLISTEGFVTEKGDLQGDLVDCEAYWLKELCDKHDIEFFCYKYVSDYVGENTIDDFYEHIGDGKDSFKPILRKFYENS